MRDFVSLHSARAHTAGPRALDAQGLYSARAPSRRGRGSVVCTAVVLCASRTQRGYGRVIPHRISSAERIWTTAYFYICGAVYARSSVIEIERGRAERSYRAGPRRLHYASRVHRIKRRAVEGV